MSARSRSQESSKAKDLAAALESARERLGWETLEERKRDALDFHDVGVRQLREVVRLVFEAGYEAGARDRYQPRTGRPYRQQRGERP